MNNVTKQDMLNLLGVTNQDLADYQTQLVVDIENWYKRNTVSLRNKIAWCKGEYICTYGQEPGRYHMTDFEAFGGFDKETIAFNSRLFSILEHEAFRNAREEFGAAFLKTLNSNEMQDEMLKDLWQSAHKERYETRYRSAWWRGLPKITVHVIDHSNTGLFVDYVDLTDTRNHGETGIPSFVLNVHRDSKPLVGYCAKKKDHLVTRMEEVKLTEIEADLSKALYKDYVELSADPDFPVKLYKVQTLQIDRQGTYFVRKGANELPSGLNVKEQYLAYCDGMSEPMVAETMKAAFSTTKRRIKKEVEAKLMAAMEGL